MDKSNRYNFEQEEKFIDALARALILIARNIVKKQLAKKIIKSKQDNEPRA